MNIPNSIKPPNLLDSGHADMVQNNEYLHLYRKQVTVKNFYDKIRFRAQFSRKIQVVYRVSAL